MDEEKRESKQVYADSLKYAACPGKMRELSKKENPHIYLSESVERLTGMLGRKIPYETACSSLLSQMEDVYKDAVFDYPWQKKDALINDYRKIRRAFDHIMDNAEVISPPIMCTCPYEERDVIVRKKADVILKKKDTGETIAVLIHTGKAKRGIKCKSIETLPKYDPGTVTAKFYLEGIFPKIIIWDIYLTSEKDTADEIYQTFDDSPLKTGQKKVNDYSEFYKDGSFDRDAFFLFAQKAFTFPGSPVCDICSVNGICKKGIPVLSPEYDVIKEPKSSYVLPEFTKEQQRIIGKDEGAFLVIAGPGSGKTATLVGRLKYLVCEKNVPPEFILAISFTNKAADEIRERCCFLKEGEEIHITTLHALGYSILNEYAQMKGEEPYRLLTKDIQCELIDDLLSDFGKALPDFSYAVRNGDKGYLSVIASYLEEYDSCGYEMIKRRGMSNDFLRFAGQYQGSIKEGRFITFDGQISKCVEILEKNPDILKIYQDMFWYVCVDEYQDIDAAQSRLIDLLSGGRGNLMAIGDDDQSIYEWRGASPEETMLRFKERYPDGELFFLSRNFRSTGNIVDLATRNLADKLKRFEKEIVAVKGPGAPVTVTEGDIPSLSVSAALSLLESGNRPEDIAVLSWSHKSLQEVIGCGKDMLCNAECDTSKCDMSENDIPKSDIPTKYEENIFIEESETLIGSAFFTFLRCVLLLKKDMDDKLSFYEYFSLFNLKEPDKDTFREIFVKSPLEGCFVRVGDIKSAVGCLKGLFSVAEGSFYEFVERAAYVSGYINQKVYPQLIEEMRLRGVESCDDFIKTSERMILSNDGKRLEADYPGKIVCTTIHEAKGREWKHVILIDDFGQKDSPQVRRLIYVALTRAIESLTIIKKEGEKSLLVFAEKKAA